MSLATILSRAEVGLEAPLVRVEVHLSSGLPAFNLVGMAETSVRESRERVRSALLNSQFEFPAKRITVNLAPADLPKDGGRYDLAIAIGILAASGQIPQHHLTDLEFVAELSLDGSLRAISGVLPTCMAIHQQQRRPVIAQADHHHIAPLQDCLPVVARHLLELTEHLHHEQLPKPPAVGLLANASSTHSLTAIAESKKQEDMADVFGQPQARRVLEIAASGGHHLLLLGPPGTGKTMLASRLPGILPPLSTPQALTSACLYSISSLANRSATDYAPPFRSPHHTSSAVALVGGGSRPKPGEISLAHHGVLFLDELPEFPRSVLDSLRQPLESGEVVISRASNRVSYPAKFQLVAAMNPCACGFTGDPQHECRCSPDQIRRYQGRISGPLLDRIDLQIDVQRQSLTAIHQSTQMQSNEESSAVIQQRVIATRRFAASRQSGCNAELSAEQRQRVCQLTKEDEQWILASCETLGMSARGFHRLLLVARTIADMALSEQIQRSHLLEALGYRQKIFGQ